MRERPAMSATSGIYSIQLTIKTSQLIKLLHLCSPSSFRLEGVATLGKETVLCTARRFFSFMYSTLKDKRYQRKVPPLHCLSRYEGPCGPCPVKMLRCVNERYPPGGRQWPGPLPKDLPHCFRACRLWRPWAFSLATASLFTEITQFASD